MSGWLRPAGFAATVLLVPALVFAGVPAPRSLAEAEALLQQREVASRARDAALRTWARRAPLDALLVLLRHDAAVLAGAEAALVTAALQRVGDDRAALRARLLTRAAMLAPPRDGPPAATLARTRPRASVFRIAALLPISGDYGSYAHSVRHGLAAGLAWARPPGAPPLTLEAWSTGEDDPARATAAFDSAAAVAAVVVGELLSVPTLALAAAAQVSGTLLVSPTAADESVGRTGTLVRQVGPVGATRGRTLARAVVARGQRVALVGSGSVARGPFARGFLAEAESLGAVVVRRETYPAGGGDFRAIARSLRAAEVELAFWDGEAREAESLVRALAAEKARLRLCGGVALAPEQHHAPVRPLLEGVAWVAEDWELEPGMAAAADSMARAEGEGDRAGSLWVRGFLVGRALARAVDAGARTPEEMAAALRHAEPDARALGELPVGALAARLAVWTARRGRAVEWAAER